MSDDDRVRQRMLEQARTYSRHYPSVIPRLKAALESRDPNLRDLVRALTDAYERSEGQRERQLKDGWALSPQEVRVTLHLIDGGTVATCAEQFGVAESTIRTHLKSVFAKTNLNRQAQLGSLLQNNSGMSSSD
jgi:DNA-binding CsgD family transcriptional regulator